MKRIPLVLCFLVVFFMHAAGQTHAWIDYSQPYFKIPVAQQGIYRLTYQNLQQAGFPVDGVDPNLIQLFHRGQEQAIHVAGQEDAQFNVSDFIEFFGRRNDGTLDADLYKPASLQPHPYHNLYSDTTSYFLTIGTATGKRMAFFNESNTQSQLATPFHYDEKIMVLADQYSGGVNISDEVFTSSFDEGEGWTGVQILQDKFATYTFNAITSVETNAPDSPQLDMLLVGRNNAPHQIEIYVGAAFRLLTSVSFDGFKTKQVTQSLNWTDIGADGNLPVRIKVVNTGIPSRASVSYMKFRYAQKTDAALATNKTFIIPEHGGTAYLEIKNPASNLRLFDITDPDQVMRIGATAVASIVQAVIPAETQRSIYASNAVLTPAIRKTSFRLINPSSHNYIVISHPQLRKPAGDYNDPVKAYAGYRASTEGGRYDTLVINIQDLYNQFNYGETSPRAIFKFLEFLSTVKTPSYLFLIGKGLDIQYKYHRVPGTSTFKDLVPTSGYPGSDAYFSTGLGNTTYEEAIPTGRLTATKPSQVAAYLDKIKEMEALPYNDLWRKKILHLSGGIEDGEPEQFKAFLEEYAGIAEAPYFGGKVSAIAKSSRDLQLINIAEEVNAGLNLVTFFGHSSPSTLDFDIGFVTNKVLGYNNPGKYPMLIMNGCEAGAFFLRDSLFGENWVMAKKKGASAFIAHSSYALVSTLHQYTSSFYEVAYGDSVYLKKGIGDIRKETARRFIDKTYASLLQLSQVQQMILLGDPAVKLFGAPKPDLEINPENVSVVSLTEAPVTAVSDSFAIQFIVRNYGLAIQEPFRVEVTRTLSDNSTIIYDSIYQIPAFSDTLKFIIRPGTERRTGNNRFALYIDADDIIAELNEENNKAVLDFNIPSNGTKNLFPYPFAIVNSSPTVLSFQANDGNTHERDFLLELDTVNTFNSDYKKAYTLTGNILFQKSVDLDQFDADTVTYYWRTRLATPLDGDAGSWQMSSFTYIDQGETGWAQVHFPQLLSDAAEGLIVDESLREIRFQESSTALDIVTFGGSAGKPRDSVSVRIGGAEYNLYGQSNGAFGCRNNTINLIAFDRRSTVPYVGIYFKWYEILYTYGGRRLICGREPFVVNSFMYNEVNTGKNNDLIQYIDNVAEGDSVLLYSIGNASIHLWPAAAKQKAGELGISEAQLNALIPGAPVVILGRKGSEPGSAQIFTSTDVAANKAKLVVNKTVTGRYSNGTLTTPLIGPAEDWNKLVWNIGEQEPGDDVAFDIVGVQMSGESEILYSDVQGNFDLSGIDAADFPYLKIIFNSSDEILLTSAQLQKWMVLYSPVAEGILVPENNIDQVTLAEGETWESDYLFINISDKAFSDSLEVKLLVFNQPNHENKIQRFRIKQPSPGDTTQFTIHFPTNNTAGLNDVEVTVNPRILPEIYYDNNVVRLNSHLLVLQDVNPPVMEVTIDGRFVENGDFVSPDPLMVVKIRDENPFILKTDTTGMRLFLTYPCEGECEPRYIILSGESVRWYPATATSDFYIEFQPASLPSGNYTLRVEGADAKGNLNTDPYEISFVVSDETQVTLIPPYPNPINGSATYGFLLSGNTVPEHFTFSLKDLTGKPVYELNFRSEDLIIGKNNFTWDTTDQQGQTLPNAIYVYEISVQLGLKSFRKRGKVFICR